MLRRADVLAQLGSRAFDLLVIGGGIVGAGIARDAAMRGLTVALVEQGDFASGTSSKTSKLIHGGLRYLEQGRLRLVFESVRERAVLRTIAPSLAHPLTLLLPIYEGASRAPWKIALGLGLYDVLAVGRRGVRTHRMLSARRALALEPGLRLDGLRAAGLYADCQMDDARLCLANILQAVHFGAVCANYVVVRQLLKANGRLCGAAGSDHLTGHSLEIRATAVVNATGPWTDGVRQLSDVSSSPRLAPTKGVHLIVPRVAQEALVVEARSDRRMLFLLPWGDYTLVGTTEAPVHGALEQLQASQEEVGYLLSEVNRALPGAHLDLDDVVATFAGARPLLAFAGASTQASREHRIEIDRWGLVSVMGGKYTTYRLMARQAVDALVTQHRWTLDRCVTDQVSLLEAVHPVSLDHWQELTRGRDPDAVGRLLLRYGAGAIQILQSLRRDPILAHPVCPHHEYLNAELLYAFQREMACTLTDVLARRTRMAWSACQGLDALSTISDMSQRHLGMPAAVMERQLDEYHRFLASGLVFRTTAMTRSASSAVLHSR